MNRLKKVVITSWLWLLASNAMANGGYFSNIQQALNGKEQTPSSKSYRQIKSEVLSEQEQSEAEEVEELQNQEPEQPSITNTEYFFRALAKCEVGSFNEINRIMYVSGDKYLQHQIIGKQNQICLAKLQTPDDRKLSCGFSNDMINYLSTAYQQKAAQQLENGHYNQQSLAFEEDWSYIKLISCELI